jgi:hypothetical protein
MGGIGCKCYSLSWGESDASVTVCHLRNAPCGQHGGVLVDCGLKGAVGEDLGGCGCQVLVWGLGLQNWDDIMD